MLEPCLRKESSVQYPPTIVQFTPGLQLYRQMSEGGLTMKVLCAAVIGFLGLLLSACVTGDEITNYVIDRDGAVDFSIYRLNLTSDEKKAADAKEDLSNCIRDLEQMRGNLFTQFAKANAHEVRVAILRKASPASVLITGHIPSLNDFAAYLSEEDKDSSFVCTPISRERTHSLVCELTRKPSKEKAQTEAVMPQADSFNATRFALTTGNFTKAQGFLLADNKRSALLDVDTIVKMWNSQIPTITLSLEWQIPETP
jgi:hypothetical protein